MIPSSQVEPAQRARAQLVPLSPPDRFTALHFALLLLARSAALASPAMASRSRVTLPVRLRFTMSHQPEAGGIKCGIEMRVVEMSSRFRCCRGVSWSGLTRKTMGWNCCVAARSVKVMQACSKEEQDVWKSANESMNRAQEEAGERAARRCIRGWASELSQFSGSLKTACWGWRCSVGVVRDARRWFSRSRGARADGEQGSKKSGDWRMTREDSESADRCPATAFKRALLLIAGGGVGWGGGRIRHSGSVVLADLACVGTEILVLLVLHVNSTQRGHTDCQIARLPDCEKIMCNSAREKLLWEFTVHGHSFFYNSSTGQPGTLPNRASRRELGP